MFPALSAVLKANKISLEKEEFKTVLDHITGKAEVKTKISPIAKKVIEVFEVVLSDNTRSHIGYLKRDGELYRRVKVYTKSSIPCQVTVKAYSVNGMYDSYLVTV